MTVAFDVEKVEASNVRMTSCFRRIMLTIYVDDNLERYTQRELFRVPDRHHYGRKLTLLLKHTVLECAICELILSMPRLSPHRNVFQM